MEKIQNLMRRLGYWALLVFGLPIILGVGAYLAYVYQLVALWGQTAA